MNLLHYMRRYPIKIIGLLVALHSIVYGLGYVIGTAGFQQTMLYLNVAEIVNPVFLGWIMLVGGLLLAYGFIRENECLVSWFSTVQSFVWLFAAFVYFLDAFFLLGIGVGLIWSLLSGYAAFSFRNRDATVCELINEKLEKYN